MNGVPQNDICNHYKLLHSKADSLLLLRYHHKAIELINTGIQQSENVLCREWYIRFLLLKIDVSHVQKDIKSEKQAIELVSLALDNYKEELGAVYNIVKADLITILARHKFDQNNFSLARRQFETALSLYNTTDNVHRAQRNVNTKVLCLWIAECYKMQGNYRESIDYYKRSILYNQNHTNTGVPANNFNTYKLIARSYIDCDDLDQAKLYFKEALTNFKQVYRRYENKSILHQKAKRLFQDLADFYIQIETPDSALHYLQRSEEFNKSFRFTDVTEITKGKAYAQLNQKRKALQHLNKALALTYSSVGKKSSQSGTINLTIGDLFEKNNDHVKALEYYQIALTNLVPHFKNEEYTSNPLILDTVIVDKHALLNVLFAKSRSLHQLYAAQDTNVQNITLALETNLIAANLIDLIKLDHITDYDKEILAQKSFQIYEQGIELCYLLSRLTPSQNQQYVAKAFQLSERAKATTLMEGIKKQSLFSEIPEEVILKEKQLDSEILSQEAALSELNEVDETSSSKAITNSLGDLRKEKRSFLEKVKKLYPGYYAQRVDKKVCTIREAQGQLLDEESAMIQYFMGDNTLYIFCITSEKVQIFRKESSPTILDSFKSFEAIIADVNTFKDPSNLPMFRRISATLYDFLLKDVLSTLSKKTKRLFVIRDGVFSNFPFELFYQTDLSSNQNDEHQNNLLLLNHFAFSYPYSATILKMQQENHLTSTSNKFFLGFAPAYDIQNTPTKKHIGLLAYIPNVLRSGLLGLAGARREVEHIKKITSGHAVIGSSATKSFLLENLKEYDILHLSMHYIKDDQNPLNAYLPFENHSKADSIEKLHTHELYSTTVAAKMVVLSACNTGDGPMQKGEGVKSLSRAFTYAGASSTLMSLWKVPDAFTQFIMTSFYENLEEGLKKDEALRQAKLDFIEEHPKYNHPFYWAGFVATGDMSTIEFPGTQFDLFSFVLVAGLLVMLCAITVKSPMVRIRRIT